LALTDRTGMSALDGDYGGFDLLSRSVTSAGRFFHFHVATARGGSPAMLYPDMNLCSSDLCRLFPAGLTVSLLAPAL
jgi:hypothetical protein